MAYAQGTTVPVEKSQAELRKLLKRFGATQSGSISKDKSEVWMFVKGGVSYKFEIPVPNEKDLNRRARVLVMVIKAKLIAIEEQVGVSFDAEFIGYAVTDNGQTVAERWGPAVRQSALDGVYPSALPQFAGGGK